VTVRLTIGLSSERFREPTLEEIKGADTSGKREFYREACSRKQAADGRTVMSSSDEHRCAAGPNLFHFGGSFISR
jgi:hypothetical protein